MQIVSLDWVFSDQSISSDAAFSTWKYKTCKQTAQYYVHTYTVTSAATASSNISIPSLSLTPWAPATQAIDLSEQSI